MNHLPENQTNRKEEFKMTNENNVKTEANENTEIAVQDRAYVGEVVVGETADYVKVRLPDGKYKRNAKFGDYTSFVPQNRKEQIWLAKLLTADADTSNYGMKDHVGKVFEMKHLITEGYTSMDEDTGIESQGAVTRIITTDNEFLVTSSKAVYMTLFNLMKYLGHPTDENYIPLKLEITSKKMANGTQINVALVDDEE